MSTALDSGGVDFDRLTPRRALLLEALLRNAGGAPLGERHLARLTASRGQHVGDCLKAMSHWGWVVSEERVDDIWWRIAQPARVEVERAVTNARLRAGNIASRMGQTLDDALGHIIATGPRMALVFEQARVAANVNAPVLLSGETGTGKELVAWAIHRLSSRADAPFTTVNAAAIPTKRVESELFGHERGAFGGAIQRRIGKLVATDGGTLFLDEVGDLPLPSQVKLLRAIQENLVMPLGGDREVSADFRLITATNRNLHEMAALKSFRSDLLYRINVFEIRLPTLRERLEDVAPLARHFLSLATWLHGVPECPDLTLDAIRKLEQHSWPGNVRELENVVYRAALLAGGDVVSADDVSRAINGGDRHRDKEPPPKVRTTGTASLEAIVRERIMVALSHCDGNLSATARELSISRVTLYRKLRQLGLAAETKDDA